ncbi:MAG: hypothetical protein AAF654_03760 [Myxococcota bacterium]
MTRHLVYGAVTIAAAAWVTACGDGFDNEVRVTGAIQSAQISSVERIDRLSLNVITATDLDSVDLPLDTLSATVALPSGALTLEVIGERQEADGTFTPVYFGDVAVFIAPGATADIVIPAFPAGALDVTVLLNPEDQPDQAVVSFTTLTPRPDQNDTYIATFDGERIRRILPSGTYTFLGQASFDGGREFEAVGDPSEPLFINQGEIISETLDLR